ncbi:hypothetical protein Tco_1182996 [Tanacetum coccineum]
MAVLESCPKHNMVAYLEKTDGNAEFHEIIDFLTRSSIHYALTVSPVISTTFVEQFWTSAKSQTFNNVRYINAKVAGKPVTISEASIRSDLHFDDVDGIDSLNNQAIFDAIKLMGYEGDLTVLTFNKALFSPQWKFLFHTLNHCLSSKSTSWDQIPTNIATALKNVPVPLDHFPIHALSNKVFSFMVKKGKHFSGKVTPLFPNMLVQPTEDEGEGSERPFEPQPTPSPPHPRKLIRLLRERTKTREGLEDIKEEESIPQVEEETVKIFQRDKGRLIKLMKREKVLLSNKVLIGKMKVLTCQKLVPPKQNLVPTRFEEGTAEPEPRESTSSAAQTTPTPTPTTFGDDETIAQVLLNMSQAKAVSKEKEKGEKIRCENAKTKAHFNKNILTSNLFPKIDRK